MEFALAHPWLTTLILILAMAHASRIAVAFLKIFWSRA